MVQEFISWIRQVWKRVFPSNDIKQATGIDVAVSSEMINALELWRLMYTNQAKWLTQNVRSLELPAAIAAEFARLTTLEMKTEITGSARADFLNTNYQRFLDDMRKYAEYGCSMGGIAFKPYVQQDGTLGVDCTPADRFLPTAFDGSGKIIGGVFVDRMTKGRKFYTRFECHSLSGGQYTIRNLVYVSDNVSTLGSPALLGSVDQWAALDEEVILGNIKGPLFGYFRVPLANNVDPDSPLGVSVYSRAVDLVRQADEQWERIQWEFKGSELALDISDRAFKLDEKTGKPVVPAHDKRLYRPAGIGTEESPLYEVFSPTIRDSSLFSGLNNILKRIEFNVGLAYGSLSDPQQVDKTAEEIKSSKQRSYATVCDLQKALQAALDDLIYAMDVWATLGKLAPAGKYEASYEWDDSIVVDTDKEFSQRLQLVSAGILRPEELRAWYTGEDEVAAKAGLPEMTALGV